MALHRTMMAVGTAALWLFAAGCEERRRDDSRAASPPKGSEQAIGAAGSAVAGQVVSAKRDEVVLKQQGAKEELKLKIDPTTQVLIDGRQASADQLREGAHVRASFDASRKATRIEASGGGAPGAGGEPASRPGGSAGTTGGLGGSSSSTPGQTGGPAGDTATSAGDPGSPRGSQETGGTQRSTK